MYLGRSNQLHTALGVNAQATVWSYVFNVGFGISFSLQYQFTSNGIVGVRIQLEEAYTKSGLTELASSSNFVVPDLQPDVVTLANDKKSHIISFTPTMGRWARFKLIGQAGNDASTTVSLVVTSQEPSRTLAGR